MRPGGRAAGSGRDHPRPACSAAALGRPLAATSHLTVKETEAEVCTVEVTEMGHAARLFAQPAPSPRELMGPRSVSQVCVEPSWAQLT